MFRVYGVVHVFIKIRLVIVLNSIKDAVRKFDFERKIVESVDFFFKLSSLFVHAGHDWLQFSKSIWKEPNSKKHPAHSKNLLNDIWRCDISISYCCERLKGPIKRCYIPSLKTVFESGLGNPCVFVKILEFRQIIPNTGDQMIQKQDVNQKWENINDSIIDRKEWKKANKFDSLFKLFLFGAIWLE